MRHSGIDAKENTKKNQKENLDDLSTSTFTT